MFEFTYIIISSADITCYKMLMLTVWVSRDCGTYKQTFSCHNVCRTAWQKI